MEENMDFKPDDCGIILVAGDDPISRFTMAITKQEYSSIGFFCSTTISGYLEVMVILIDVFGTNTPSWLQTNNILTMSNTKMYTLNDLINNDLITKASIKKLRRNEHFDSRQMRLRSAIADLMTEEYELPLIEAIYQLFGHPLPAPINEQPTSKKRRLTAIEMVNMVIYSIGEWDKVPQNGNVSLSRVKDISTPKPVKNDAAGKLSLISMLGAPFIQQEVNNPNTANKLIQSYIMNNELFDELIELRIPRRDALKLDIARTEAIGIYRNYLIKILTTTLDEMLRNQAFFQTVINGINRNQKLLSHQFANNDLLAIMSSVGKSAQNILILVSESLKTGKLNGTKLQTVAKELNDTLRHTFPKSNIHQVPLSLPKKNGYIKYIKPNDGPTKSSVIKDKSSAVKSLNYDILQILNAIQQNKMPEINLENLIAAANTLNDGSQPLITPLKEEFSVSAIVYNGQKDLDHTIKLENGKEYILPVQGADLNTFSYTELQEMAKILDTTDSNNLISLKRDIMKKLSHLKNK